MFMKICSVTLNVSPRYEHGMKVFYEGLLGIEFRSSMCGHTAVIAEGIQLHLRTARRLVEIQEIGFDMNASEFNQAQAFLNGSKIKLNLIGPNQFRVSDPGMNIVTLKVTYF